TLVPYTTLFRSPRLSHGRLDLSGRLCARKAQRPLWHQDPEGLRHRPLGPGHHRRWGRTPLSGGDPTPSVGTYQYDLPDRRGTVRLDGPLYLTQSGNPPIPPPKCGDPARCHRPYPFPHGRPPAQALGGPAPETAGGYPPAAPDRRPAQG